jgi:hypothetical protein
MLLLTEQLAGIAGDASAAHSMHRLRCALLVQVAMQACTRGMYNVKATLYAAAPAGTGRISLQMGVHPTCTAGPAAGVLMLAGKLAHPGTARGPESAQLLQHT